MAEGEILRRQDSTTDLRLSDVVMWSALMWYCGKAVYYASLVVIVLVAYVGRWCVQ